MKNSLRTVIESALFKIALEKTNVTGIQGDVTALKAKIDELNAGGDAAVQAALAELTPFVDSVGSKIAAINQATADLDAQTS